MKTNSWLACSLALALVGVAAGQQQQRLASPPANEEGVRVTTNLVQVDAVVTDRDGKQVTDLRPEDFEIFEDGHPQQITHFAYINATQPATDVAAPATAPATHANETLAPPTPLDPRRAHRTLALVVDDLGMSFESMPPMPD